ncbi:MAG: zinc-binding alcohol dehydrogenase [Spirochaetales bacterium]
MSLTLKTDFSAISSGTERLLFTGQFPEELELDAVIPELQRAIGYPFAYGYSLVGRCVEVGTKVDPVLLGKSFFAFHPHQDVCRLPLERVMPVPDEIPLRRALFYPFLETAITLVLDAAPLWGERVAVFGLGTIGLLVTRILSKFPLANLTAFEPQSARRTRGLAAGASVCLSGPHESGTDNFDVVIELSGTQQGLSEAFRVVGFSGRIVSGSWHGQSPVDSGARTAFHRKRVTLISSQVSTIAPALSARWTKERRAAQTWQLLAITDLESDIAAEVPFEDSAEAFRSLISGAASGQIVLTYPE